MAVPYPDWLSEEAKAARRESHAHDLTCRDGCLTGPTPSPCPEGERLWHEFKDLRERDRQAQAPPPDEAAMLPRDEDAAEWFFG
jgi:hypothetical protein